MISRTSTKILALGLSICVAAPAFSAPILRDNVAVSTAIVTVGDMFNDAGINAERPLFRAPAPGTSGAVSLEAIRLAAKRAGITDFQHSAITRVQVERTGIPVDGQTLKDLISNELTRRGIITGNVIAHTLFEKSFSTIHAATSDEPVRLANLRHTSGAGTFTAYFNIAGTKEPLELRGRVDLMIEAPHLTSTMPRNTILSTDDIEMRPILLRYVEHSGIATLEQLVGKELRRPAREGMMLHASDVSEPKIIKRSDMVTLYYQRGPLNLTVKGQALNAAIHGESVAVLNLVSKKIVHGVAVSRGSVEMVSTSAHLANTQS